MEDELNYLSTKIADLEGERDYYEREANKAEDQDSRTHNNWMAEKRNTELEHLNNILNAVTCYVLAE